VEALAESVAVAVGHSIAQVAQVEQTAQLIPLVVVVESGIAVT
jgi:hypothetical protein